MHPDAQQLVRLAISVLVASYGADVAMPDNEIANRTEIKINFKNSMGPRH